MFALYRILAAILVLALLAAWLLAKLRSVSLRYALAIFVPVAISFAWGFLPRLTDLFGPDLDDWKELTLTIVFAFSVVAVPVCLVATFVFTRLRNRRQKSHAS